MKQPEKSIPSFASLALQYDMVSQEQLNEADRFIEEKKVSGVPCSLEEALLFNKIITQHQVNLLKVIRDFLIVRKKSEQFGSIAVNRGYATAQQIKYALVKQQQLFREKKIRKMVGDLLVEAGVLTVAQQQAVVKDQQAVTTGKGDNESSEEEISDNEKIEVTLLPDAMEAWVKVVADSNLSVSDTSGSNIQAPAVPDRPVTLMAIKSALEKRGVVNGILSDAILQCHIDRKDDFFLAAVGEYHCNHRPEYQFNFDKIVSETAIKKNRTIALLKSEKVKITREDLFGRLDESVLTVGTPLSVESTSIAALHPLFRCANGVSLSEDGTRVISEQSGYPALSIEKRLYIFPVVNILADADTHFGPIDSYASVNVAGILTGAYPVNAGQVRAREIRGAKVSSTGDISVEIGITSSHIRTQGSVRAKYIHNSRVEAFGDVVVEHEIVDSTVIISGECNTSCGRIIASKISAKMGIRAASVGSNITDPCYISAGREDHIVRHTLQITSQIANARKELDDLTEEKKMIDEKIKELFKKMVELKVAHDRARAESLELTEVNEKSALLTDALKKQMEEAVDALKRYNQQKKKLEHSLEKTEKSIIRIRPKVEQEIMELELDRRRFLKWAESKPAVPEISISGRLSEGTIIKGIFSSLAVNEDLINIRLVEEGGGDNASIVSVRQA